MYTVFRGAEGGYGFLFIENNVIRVSFRFSKGRRGVFVFVLVGEFVLGLRFGFIVLL